MVGSLIHAWKLDEASGVRADVVGSMTLTDNNTVGAGAGLLYPNAALFVATSLESLSHVADASLDFIGSTCLEMWVNFASTPPSSQTRYACAKRSGGNNWAIGYVGAASGSIYLVVWDTGGTQHAALVPISPVVGTWYHFVGWYDSADKKVRATINNATPIVSTALPNIPATGAAGFVIGAQVTSSYHWDGRIGPVRMFRAAPAAADITALYNGGAGLAYPGSYSIALGGATAAAQGQSLALRISRRIAMGAASCAASGKTLALLVSRKIAMGAASCAAIGWPLRLRTPKTLASLSAEAKGAYALGAEAKAAYELSAEAKTAYALTATGVS
jgi:hypothetical protein